MKTGEIVYEQMLKFLLHIQTRLCSENFQSLTLHITQL